MILNSYPILRSVKTCIFIVSLLVSGYACNKDMDKKPPQVILAAGNGQITDSVVVPTGYPYKIGINASKGDAAITNLVVTLTTENGMETAVDSGMYSNDFHYTRNISYGASRFEKWSFMLRDKNGKSASTSVIVFKDENSVFGPITVYPSVTLAAQGNLGQNSFFSIAGGIGYTQQEATAQQSDINIITYFGNLLVPPTEFTLSSPADNDVASFYPMILNWTLPRNETRYKPDSLSISQSAFDAAYNDSLIITNYTSATIGKRKFKTARAGYVIPFQVSIGNAAGKRGLIRIKSMQNGLNGTIVADIKVQK